MSSELRDSILKEANVREESFKAALRHQVAYCKRDLSGWAEELTKMGRFPVIKNTGDRRMFGPIHNFGLLDIYPDFESREAICLNKSGQIWVFRCFNTGEARRILIPGETEVNDQGYITHTPTALRRMAQLLEAQS